ncbi:MAG: cobalt ECF transporter T component CbiQ [Lachnospiraceae bacterium]
MKHHHTDQISIDAYAYESKLQSVNPTFKLLFSLAVIFVCIGLNQVSVSVCVLLGMTVLVVIKGGMNLWDYLSVFKIPLVFILLGTIAIGFDVSFKPPGGLSVHIIFFYIYTSMEQIAEMGQLMLKVFASVSALQFLILTTPAAQVIAALSNLHLPKLITELMHMIYRYIFILLNVYDRMKNSALSRGGYNTFSRAVYTFGSIGSNLFIVAMKKAGDYYDAMEARCYDGELNIFQEKKKVSWQQITAAVVFIGFLCLLKVLARR